MADGITITLDGVAELRRAMADASVQIRTKAVRNALKEAGKVIQAAARAAAPVLAVPTERRKPGTVKKAIYTRVSKFARQAGNEGVFVNVRPLRGAARIRKLGKAGANNPNDPYYWRFLEFGTRRMAARPFLRPSATGHFPEAIDKFMSSVVPQINKLNAKAAAK